MLRIIGCSAALASLILVGTASAQDSASVLLPGRTTRITLTDGAKTQGTVVSIDPSIMRLAVTGGDTVSLTRGAVKKVEIYQGMRTTVGRDALTGGLVGAALGALLGAASAKSTEGSFVEYSAGEGALAYGAVFGVLGAGIGALVGTKHRPSWGAANWPTVAMGPVASGGGGMSVVVRYSF